MKARQNSASRDSGPQNLLSVGLLEKFCRTIGTSNFLPLKLRALAIDWIVGNEQRTNPRQFRVSLYDGTYEGHTGSHIDWYVYYFGQYDPTGVRLLRTLASANPDLVALDIGANTGTHALCMAEFASSVFCFEPFPPALEALRQNVDSNKLNDKIEILPYGLSSHNDTLPFFENQCANLGAGSFSPQERPPDRMLEVRNGDSVITKLRLARVDLIKIDTEGHEPLVFGGLQKTIQKFQPAVYWENSKLIDQQVLNEYFPEGYCHFQVTHLDRWTRTKPKLIPILESGRANLLSIPQDQLSLVEAYL